MKTNTDQCYLCGSTENLTRDHIPPKCLFREPRPHNLITVPCCFDCNNGLSKQDELLRLVVCGAVNRNNKGHKLWDEKVVPNTIQRGRLKDEVRSIVRTARDCTCNTPQGQKPAKFMTVPQEGISDSLVRIAKGLMYENSRDVDRNSLLYKTVQIDQFRLNEMIDPIVPMLKWKGERGDGAFRYWGGKWKKTPMVGFGYSCSLTQRHLPYSMNPKTGRTRKMQRTAKAAADFQRSRTLRAPSA